jgi:hypothetical protein
MGAHIDILLHVNCFISPVAPTGNFRFVWALTIWSNIQLTCEKEASALCFHLSGAAFLVMTRRLARQIKQTAITGQPAKEIRNPIFIWNDTFVPVILKMRIINLVHFAFQQSWLKKVFSLQYTTCYKQLLRRSVPGLEIHRNGSLCPTLVN